MIYGEHLCAEEALTQCACGAAAIGELFDKSNRTHGWFCRRCGSRKLQELRRMEKIAKANVRKGSR